MSETEVQCRLGHTENRGVHRGILGTHSPFKESQPLGFVTKGIVVQRHARWWEGENDCWTGARVPGSVAVHKAVTTGTGVITALEKAMRCRALALWCAQWRGCAIYFTCELNSPSWSQVSHVARDGGRVSDLDRTRNIRAEARLTGCGQGQGY